MKKIIHDFIPKSESGFLLKSQHYKKYIRKYMHQLGKTEEEVQQEIEMIDCYEELINRKNQMRYSLKTLVNQCDQQRKKMDRHFRLERRKALLNEQYNRQMEIELGFDAPVIRVESQGKSPDLKVCMEAGKVRIFFTKKGMDGIRLFSRREGEENFSFLDSCFKSPYVDDRTILCESPGELREYRAYYLNDGNMVGNLSQTVRVFVERRATISTPL